MYIFADLNGKFSPHITKPNTKKMMKKFDLLRKMTLVPLAKNVVGMVMFAMDFVNGRPKPNLN